MRSIGVKKLFITALFWCVFTSSWAVPVENSVMVEIDTIEMTEGKVENVIAEPIEILLGSLDDVFMVSAKYSDNKAIINVKFSESLDGPDALVTRVKATIDSYMDKLPDSIESISVSLGEPSEPVGSATAKDHETSVSAHKNNQNKSASEPETTTSSDSGTAILDKPGVIKRAEKRTMVGRYLGSIESSNEFLPVITTLVPLGSVTDSADAGKYQMSESDEIVIGTLSGCYNNTGNVLTCQWRDKYGMGGVDFIFTPDYSSFNGRWSISGKEGAYKWYGIKVKEN